MKKMLAVLACAVSMSAVANLEQFEKDVAVYHNHKSDAHAIITLISSSGMQNKMLIALEKRSSGDAQQWQKIVSALRSGQNYADKIPQGSYLSNCANAIYQGQAMWSYAVSGATQGQWKNEGDKARYNEGKKEFDTQYSACKDSHRDEPKKENYAK